MLRGQSCFEVHNPDAVLLPRSPRTSTPLPPAPHPQGAKPLPLLASVAVGLALRFLVPVPAGVTLQAWTLLSIFTSTIVGLVLEPLPVGAWAMLSVTTALATGTLTFPQAFSAFTNDVIWLIVVSFFFARGFEQTGLGERVATIFVKLVGKSTLGLAYGLSLAEMLIAPAMPSTTARAGGIFMPIINSLSLSSGSKPSERGRGGRAGRPAGRGCPLPCGGQPGGCPPPGVALRPRNS